MMLLFFFSPGRSFYSVVVVIVYKIILYCHFVLRSSTVLETCSSDRYTHCKYTTQTYVVSYDQMYEIVYSEHYMPYKFMCHIVTCVRQYILPSIYDNELLLRWSHILITHTPSFTFCHTFAAKGESTNLFQVMNKVGNIFSIDAQVYYTLHTILVFYRLWSSVGSSFFPQVLKYLLFFTSSF